MANWQDTINSRNYHFSAKIDSWVRETQKRMDAVMKSSIQDVINEAQTPVAQGGRMRVKTGFLRASGILSLDGMPSGPARGEKDKVYKWSDSDAMAKLNGVEAGDSIHFGWTAVYAKYREAYDGFLIVAVANWQQIVDRNARRAWWRSPNGGSAA